MLESTRRVNTIVLDKTGTVTTGEMALVNVVLAEGEDRAEVLRLVGALEDGSEHPIARAIARAARDELGPLPGSEGFTNREGLGVEGVVDGHGVVVGRPALLADRGLAANGSLGAARESAEAAGRTAVTAAWDGRVRALLVVADTVKPTSAEAIRDLRDLGLRPVLLTGDNAATARTVAAAVGIDEVISAVLPSRRRRSSAGFRRTDGWSRWWATASTTPPPWPRPISAWRSAPAPTWRSRRPTSPSSRATFARRPTPSACRAAP